MNPDITHTLTRKYKKTTVRWRSTWQGHEEGTGLYFWNPFCPMTEGSQMYPLSKAKEKNLDVKTGPPVECLARSLAKQGKNNMKRQKWKRNGAPQVSVPKRYVVGISIGPEVWMLALAGRWSWRLQSCWHHCGVEGKKGNTWCLHLGVIQKVWINLTRNHQCLEVLLGGAPQKHHPSKPLGNKFNSI